MEHLEAVIIRIIPAVLVAMLSITTGCKTFRDAKHEVTDAVGITEYSAPTQVLCFWQKQVAYLSNPTREGEMSPGIVGQVFVWDSTKSAINVEGELFVKLTDESSKTPLTPEVFHFDPKTLKKLITKKDERWGDCYAMFIPLQPGWENVKNVRIQVQFAPKRGMPISDSGEAFAIESGPINPQTGIRSNFDRQAARPASMPGMQDMKKFMTQMKDGKNSGVVNVQSTMKADDKRQIVIPAKFDTPMQPNAPVPLAPTAPIIVPASANIPIPVPPAAPTPSPTPVIPTASASPIPVMPVATPTVVPVPVIARPTSDMPPAIVPASLSLPAGAGEVKDSSGLPMINLPEVK